MSQRRADDRPETAGDALPRRVIALARRPRGATVPGAARRDVAAGRDVLADARVRRREEGGG